MLEDEPNAKEPALDSIEGAHLAQKQGAGDGEPDRKLADRAQQELGAVYFRGGAFGRSRRDQYIGG